MAINMFKPDVILKGKDSSESPLPKSFLERYIGGLSTGFSSILGYYLSKIWKQHSNLAWGTSVFQFLWNGLKFSFSHSFLFLFLMHAYVHLRYTNILDRLFTLTQTMHYIVVRFFYPAVHHWIISSVVNLLYVRHCLISSEIFINLRPSCFISSFFSK